MARWISGWAWAAVALPMFVSSAAFATEVSGAGSTFAFPVMAKWASAFKASRDVTVNYQSLGSGAGVKQVETKTVDFGVSDAPLTVGELDKFGLVQFPLVIGGAVPVVNLRGVGPGQLKLSGGVLADIYLGKITKWNDPAIVKLNAGIQLPNQAIAVVYRSDGSGTTYIWADYLSKVSPEWNEKVGVNMALDWPTGLGGKGNEGVAAVTARTAGAIGYLEYAYAKQNKMTYALVDCRDGTFVEPKKETFQAAAANADWSKAPGFNLMLTYQPGKDSWPITGTSFVLMHKVQDKPAIGKPLLEFFDWAFAHGAEMAESLDYVPIPSGVADLVRATWRDVIGTDQKPLWSAEAK